MQSSPQATVEICIDSIIRLSSVYHDVFKHYNIIIIIMILS